MELKVEKEIGGRYSNGIGGQDSNLQLSSIQLENEKVIEVRDWNYRMRMGD